MLTKEMNAKGTIPYDKIQKVAELAKRGVDGEKQAAQKLLFQLLTKYGLSLNDIPAPAPKQLTCVPIDVEEGAFNLNNILFKVAIGAVHKMLGDIETFQHKTKPLISFYWHQSDAGITAEVKKHVAAVQQVMMEAAANYMLDNRLYQVK